MDDWQIIYKQAKKYWEAKKEFPSLFGGKKYKIISVNNDQIVIDRINGGKNAPLSKKGATKAINKLRDQKSFGRMKLTDAAARQSTIIELHPCIHWDVEEKLVYWKDLGFDINSFIGGLEDASDDELQRIESYLQKRSHQSKFRKNILILYNQKCAISDVELPEVLDAAHILSHTTSGVNSNDNGILLRSDLHKLFDKNLIAIDPETNQICLHNSLKGSYYEQYSGQKIASRIDGSEINTEYLKSKFKKFKSSSK